MTFREKLRRLTEDMHKAKVARRAGMGQPQFHEYLQGVTPRIDTAARIARALHVDVGWLIDDAREWPPVRVETSDPTPASSAAA